MGRQDHPRERPQGDLRLLIVGAGAVGQVYGYHLQRGGASVAFLVRPAYAEACRGGLTLYPRAGHAGPIAFTDFDVLSDLADVGAQAWAYLRFHFTKVGDQTRAALRTYAELGLRHGCDVDALEALLARITEPASEPGGHPEPRPG